MMSQMMIKETVAFARLDPFYLECDSKTEFQLSEPVYYKISESRKALDTETQSSCSD